MRALAVAFSAGFCTLVIELSGSRLIAPFLGNSIYTWSAAIGVVFAASSAGYYLGSRSGDLADSSLKASIGTLLSMPLFALISQFFIFMPPGISHIAGALMLALPCFFLGMVLTGAIAERSVGRGTGEASGEVFAVSTAGSLAGALAAGFVLIPNLPLAYVFVLCSAIMLGASWLAARVQMIELAPFCMLAAIGIISLPVPFHDTDILFQAQSPYQLVTVSRVEHEGKGTTAMMLDHLVEDWEYADGSPVYDYFERGRLAYGILQDEPERALVIGAGGGTHIRMLREDFPGIHIDAIEIDPVVVEAGRRYFSLAEDADTRIFIEDGRRGLRGLDGGYDIVLIDVFKGQSMPNHMVSREFFGEVKSVMDEEGILVMNIASDTDSEFYRDIHSTLETQFDDVAAMPHGRSGENLVRQTIILVASDADMGGFRQGNAESIHEPAEGAVFTDDWSPADILNPV